MDPKTAKLVGTISLVLNVILLLLVAIFGYMLMRGRGAAATTGFAINTEFSKFLLAEPECILVSKKDALLIIDVQNDFLPSRPLTTTGEVPKEFLEGEGKIIKKGSLEVPAAKDITSHINKLVEVFEKNGNVIYSLDWHPEGHCSFDPSKKKEKVKRGESTDICRDKVSLKAYNAGELMRWPPHCVQGEFGARLDPNLRIAANGVVVKKGFRKEFDSYSAFGGAVSSKPIQESSLGAEDMTKADRLLANELLDKKIERIFVVGIATDYCVNHTVEDALKEAMGTLGINAVAVVKEAVGAVFPDKDAALFEGWKAKGVAVLSENNKAGKFRFAEKC